MRKIGRLILPVFIPSCLAIWSLQSMQGTIAYSDEFELIVESKNLFHGVFDAEFGWFCPIQKMIYGILASVWGFHTYLPYRLCGVFLVWLTGAALAFRYSRKSLVLMVAVPFWFATLAGAFHSLLWPAATWPLVGVFALLMAERIPISNLRGVRYEDLFAFGLSSLALLTSGPMGIPFAVAITVLRFRRASHIASIFAAIPLFLYTIIIVFFNSDGGSSLATPIWQNTKNAGSYVMQALLGSASTFTGVSELGPIAIVVIAILYTYCFSEFNSRQRRLHFAWVVGTLFYWIILALSRGHFNEPAAPRYTIIGSLTLLVLMADCLVVIFERSVSKINVWGFGMIACLTILPNWNTLELRTNDFQYLSGIHRVKLTALELVSPNVPDNYELDPVNLPQFDWLAYINSIQSKGSPGYSLEEFYRRPVGEGQIADEILTKFSNWNSNDLKPSITECSTEVGSVAAGSVVLRNISGFEQSATIHGFSLAVLWNLTVPADSTVEFQWTGNARLDLQFKMELNGLTFCT